jgi:hypothetical protein
MSSLNAATLTTARRNKMAMKYGLVLGLLHIVVISLVNMAATTMVLFSLLRFAGYMVYLVILGFMLARIRKANGGYIELRELFGPAFIILVIAGGISHIYEDVYVYLIDPFFFEKMLNASIKSFGKGRIPDWKIAEMMAEIGKRTAFNLGNTILRFFSNVLIDCLFGLLVSLIIKKQRPFSENLT